ncbi:hypothetical protein LXL04_032811 [Taraxacum kok-saghyz]
MTYSTIHDAMSPLGCLEINYKPFNKYVNCYNDNSVKLQFDAVRFNDNPSICERYTKLFGNGLLIIVDVKLGPYENAKIRFNGTRVTPLLLKMLSLLIKAIDTRLRLFYRNPYSVEIGDVLPNMSYNLETASRQSPNFFLLNPKTEAPVNSHLLKHKGSNLILFLVINFHLYNLFCIWFLHHLIRSVFTKQVRIEIAFRLQAHEYMDETPNEVIHNFVILRTATKEQFSKNITHQQGRKISRAGGQKWRVTHGAGYTWIHWSKFMQIEDAMVCIQGLTPRCLKQSQHEKI